MVYDFTPFSVSRKLWDAYDQSMQKLLPHEFGILRDADTIYCSPNYGELIDFHTRNHGGKVFTCLTNRIGCDFQLDESCPSGNDYASHREHGIRRQKQHFMKVKEVTGTMSGFWMCIRKDVWDKIPRPSTTRILHVDTHIAKSINAMGEKTYLLQGLYLFHYYSGYTGIGKRNVAHLM